MDSSGSGFYCNIFLRILGLSLTYLIGFNSVLLFPLVLEIYFMFIFGLHTHESRCLWNSDLTLFNGLKLCSILLTNSMWTVVVVK